MLLIDPPIVPAIEHYTLGRPENCGCIFCKDLVEKKKLYADSIADTKKNDCNCKPCRRRQSAGRTGHANGAKGDNCQCDRCTYKRERQAGMVASALRRDVWIEMSFHASCDSAMGDNCMEWLYVFLLDPLKTDTYWANPRSSEKDIAPIEMTMGDWTSLYFESVNYEKRKTDGFSAIALAITNTLETYTGWSSEYQAALDTKTKQLVTRFFEIDRILDFPNMRLEE